MKTYYRNSKLKCKIDSNRMLKHLKTDMIHRKIAQRMVITNILNLNKLEVKTTRNRR